MAAAAATASALPAVGARIFTRFRDLPREIRLQIWQLLLPPPRIVFIVERPLVGAWRWSASDLETLGFEGDELQEQYHRYEEDATWGFESPCPAPEILFVCRESYSFYSRFYSQAFSKPSSFPQTYFDFGRDFLFIDAETFNYYPNHQGAKRTLFQGISSMDPNELSKVRNLALAVPPAIMGNNPVHGTPEGCLVSILGLFGNVERLVLVSEYREHSFTFLLTKGPQFEKRSNLTFMDPVDVRSALKLFNGPIPNLDAPIRLERHQAFSPVNHLLQNMDLFEQCRKEWIAAHSCDLPLPELDIKLLVSQDFKEKFLLKIIDFELRMDMFMKSEMESYRV